MPSFSSSNPQVEQAIRRLRALEQTARQSDQHEFAEAAVLALSEIELLLAGVRPSPARFAGQEIDLLYRISQAAVEVDNLLELCRSIHHILDEILKASDFYIALYDRASDTISFPYYIDQYDAPPPPQKPGRGLTEYVLRTGKPLLATPERFMELVQAGEVELDGAQSIDWLGVPLRVDMELIGVMAIQSYTEEVRYSQRDVEMLSFVADQVGHAIHRRQAIEAMRQQLEELTVLHEVGKTVVSAESEDRLIESITRLIGETMFVDDFGVMLIDREFGILCPHPSYHGMERLAMGPNVLLGQGITGWVAQTGQTVRVSDVTADPHYLNAVPSTRSELCTALRVGGEIIGVINAESTIPNAFSEADQRLVETLAGQVATSIEKLRLLETSRKHVERLNALHTIDRSINGNIDLPVTLHVVLDQTINQLAVDAADVYLMNALHGSLEFAAGKGFRSTPFERTGLKLRKGRAERIAVQRTPLYIPSFLDAPEMLDPSLHLPGEDFCAYFGVPIIAKGQVKGILEVFNRRPLVPDSEWLSFLTTLAGQAAIAIDNAALFDALQRTNQELAVAYEATLEGWSRALELRDRETEGHTLRVTDLAVKLAERMGVDEDGLVHIRRGSLLHDIGKLGIPDSILQKPGPLTDEEWDVMHQHPLYAFNLLHPISYLRPALDIPYRHHEKWNGTGYPFRLQGEQIPLAARIFAIVDVWDALISDRPYRKAWTYTDTMQYIQAQAGEHFDPDVTEVFMDLIQAEL